MPVDRTTGNDTSILLELDLADRLLQIFLDLERRLVADIARLLNTGMEAPTWAQDKLLQVQELRRAATQLLAAAVQDTEGLVAQTLVLAYMRGGEAASRELATYATPAAASLLAQLGGPDVVPDETLRDIVTAQAHEAAGMLARATRAFPGLGALQRMVWSLASRLRGTFLPILRWAEDIYRQVIAETALPSVLLGVATRRREAQAAWERLLANGVTGFVDRAGRRWELASYVEMAVRSGVAQAAVEGHMDRLAEAKLDLVIVSNAAQECEKCRPWEGKVLHRVGPPGAQTITVPSARTGKPIQVEIAGSLPEAIAAGLHHPNCRHNISAFLPGATRIPTHTADPEGDKARQRLRYLERRVRKEKLLAAGALSEDARKAYERKARVWQAKIREHVTATEHLGIRRKPDRERIGTAR